MAIIKHIKTNAITDWTQPQLDDIIAGNPPPLPPPGTTLSQVVLPSDWNNDHTVSDIVNADIADAAGILLSKTNISLTTTGSSGAATLDTTTGVLNIPEYSGGGGGAPTGAEYVVLSANGSLTHERVLTSGTGISITDGGAGSTVTVASTITQYTDEMAQDAVGGILVDSAEIDFTYNDGTPSITASIVAGSIDETKLDTSVNTSLDLADSALQAADIGVSVQAYSAVLAATTASFTTTLQTKLNGIETGADVTDTTNVAAAGAAMLGTGGTFAADISVPDEAYGSGWNGSVEVPTKNAIYDKIETLGGGGSLSSGYRTNAYYPSGFNPGSTTSFDANKLYYTPFLVTEDVTFNRIGVRVMTGGTGGCLARLGLYANLNGQPTGTPLLDAGTVACDSTGDKEITISQPLTAGWYWLASINDGGGQALRGIVSTGSNYPRPDLGSLTTTNPAVALYTQSHTFGALPTVASLTAEEGTPTQPRIWMRKV